MGQLPSCGLKLFQFSPCEGASIGPCGQMFCEAERDLIDALFGEVLFQLLNTIHGVSIRQG